MGNTSSYQKVNFEEVQIISKNKNNNENYHNNYNGNYIGILINVLLETEQSCLIDNTLSYKKEEEVINYFLQKKRDIKIIIYGKNANDENIYKKYNQLRNLGFYNVYIFIGGLFQWLLLQDIYGVEEFSTTTKCLDILKYKEKQSLTNNILYIENV